MSTNSNPAKESLWVRRLKQKALAILVLILCAILAMIAVLLSSPGHLHAAGALSPSHTQTLKSIPYQGLAGPPEASITNATVGWTFGANNLQYTSDGSHSWKITAVR